MSIRSNLVVEHNMNILITDYELKGVYNNCLNDIKLKFIDFLLEFTKDEVKHGIKYLFENDRNLYNDLGSLILEYQNFGLKSFMDSPEIIEEKPKETFFDRIKSFFKKETADGRK